MFEFDQYEPALNSRVTTPRHPYLPFSNASRKSLLVWAEHCTECAAPDCYATCQLYQPRPDRRCRRFEFGISPNRFFPAGGDIAAEVVFKNWGVLGAQGNATMLPVNRVRWMQRIATAARPHLSRLGKLIDRTLKDIRYSYISFALLERLNGWLFRHYDSTLRPDAFVFECYNPSACDVAVQFRVSIARTKLPKSVRLDQLPPPFAARLVISPGYFRRDIPFEQLSPLIDTLLPFELSITPEAAEDTRTHLVFLTLDFVVYENPDLSAKVDEHSGLVNIAPAPPLFVAEQGRREPNLPAAKCVVFDLDNTLWTGTLLEGDVILRANVKQLLRELDSRGILLSIASKNSSDHVHEKLVEMGIEDYFLFPRINWGRKSDNLKEIAKDFDIGVDTFIFIDDNAFERNEVAAALPQVEVLDEESIAGLLAHPRLKGSTSGESKKRRTMYRQAAARSAAAREFGEDYIGFLRSCRIRVEIRPPAPEDRERISELVQRTNQLNFSGRKYKEEEVDLLLADAALEKWVIVYDDNFGSSGIVGFCVAIRSADTVRILDFMLSCRVQGRFVEQALFHHLINDGMPVECLEINFKRTSRNAPAQAVLSKFGFETAQDGALIRKVTTSDFELDFMEIVVPAHQ